MKKHTYLLVLACLFSAITVSAAETSQMTKERSKRLSRSGRLEVNDKTSFYPFDPPERKSISVPIRAAQTSSSVVKALRLHFVFNAEEVNKAGQNGTWKVIAKDGNGRELWRFDSKANTEVSEFWSPQLPVDAVVMTVESDVKNPALKLECDKRIEYIEPIQEKSFVGPDDSVPITLVTDKDHLKWARSVARLTFEIKGDQEVQVFTCTGFLVAENLFVTNDHCPRGDNEIKSSIVEFDYDSETARPEIYSLKTELARHEDLDFAFYELNKSVTGRESLKFSTKAQPLPKSLLLIQHPGGRPKRLAAINCNVKTSATGVQPATDFGHVCDTEKGSSGAPVQDLSGVVVGIHHFGFDQSIQNPDLQFNQAVKIEAIIKLLRERANNGDLKAQKVLQMLDISQ